MSYTDKQKALRKKYGLNVVTEQGVVEQAAPRQSASESRYTAKQEELRKKYGLDRDGWMEELEASEEDDGYEAALQSYLQQEKDAKQEKAQLRDATFKDLTVNSFNRGFYNSRLGEETFQELLGAEGSDADKYRKILEGEEYQFDTDKWWEKAVSGTAEQLGQWLNQWSNPQSLTAAAAGAGTAWALGKAGPQALVPEEIITMPAAAAAGLRAGSTVSNLQIEAGHAYNEMTELGIDPETASAAAFAVGGANAAIEGLQLKKLEDAYKVLVRSNASDNLIKRIGKVLAERGVDVAKETAQEVAQETVTMGGVTAANLIDKGAMPYTGEEMAQRLGETALSSALTFGLMNVPAGAMQIAADTANARAQAKAEPYLGKPDALINEVLALDPENQIAKQLQGESAVNTDQLMQLMWERDRLQRPEMPAVQKRDAETASPQSPTATAPLAKGSQETAAVTEGAEEETVALEQASEKYGAQAGAMIHTYQQGQDVQRYDMAYQSAYEMGKSGVNRSYAMNSAATAYLTETQRELAYEAGKDSENAVKVPESADEYDISDEGKALYKVTDAAGNVTYEVAKPGKVVSVEGKDMVIEVGDGVEAASADISYATEGEAVMYHTVATVANTADEANALLGGYAASGLTHEQYAAGIRNAYDAGRFNEPKRAVMKQRAVKRLPADVAEAAYAAGRSFATGSAEKAEAAVKAKIPEGAKAQKHGTVQFMEGSSRSDFRTRIKQKGKTLNAKQEAAIQTAEMLSQMTGVNFIVYESYRNAEGKLVYSDRSGEEVPAPNGFYYDGTGDIYIDLNAGNSGDGLMLYTMAHELTHFIKSWSPKKYRILANALMDEYSKTEGKTVERLTEEQILKAAGNGRAISEDVAYEEVVANSMEQILESGRVAEFMAEIKQQDKSLWQKIKQWFKDFADKLRSIREAYAGAKPDSAEAKIIAGIDGALERLEPIFAEALAEAGDNYQSAATKNTADGGGVKYQARENKKITISMTDSERTEILKDKVITAAIYEGQADNAIRKRHSDLESGKMGLVKSALVRIGEEFDVFTDYKVSDVEVKFTLSRSNLKESVSKDVSGVQLAKLLPVLKQTVENAVGIECHANRYYYDNDTVMFENLLGGYVDEDSFVPVRFGLKHSKTGQVTLYVVVDQNPIGVKKIKAEVVKTPGTHSVQPVVSRSAYNYSVPSVIPFVNGKDLLRYLPDDMLTADQKKVKWEAIADTIIRTNNKNDKKYAEYIRDGKIDAAKQMVITAAKTAGYNVEAWHGTPNAGFTVFDRKKIGSTTDDGLFGRGFYFSTNKATADGYATPSGKTMDVFLQAKKPWWSIAHHNIQEVAEELGMDESAFTYQRNTMSRRIVVPTMAQSGQFTAHLIERGYDSIVVQHGKNDYEVVVFNPDQIKSADPVTYDDNGSVIPLSQRFNAENPDIRYSERTTGDAYAPTFYSHMANVIDGVKQEKLGAASVVPMLRGKGVKQEEIKWSGIEQFLEGKKSVTKQELREFAAGNMLEIEEKELSDKDTIFYTEAEQRDLQTLGDWYDRRTEQARTLWQEAYGEEMPWDLFFNDDSGAAISRAIIARNGGMRGFRGVNELSDAERTLFTEVCDGLRMLDSQMRDIRERAEARQKNTSATYWSQYKLDGGENYREYLFKMPESEYRNKAMDAHWKGETGVLAHARVQDFETPDGKMLFVEEIQSDWHNEGHKQGYRGEIGSGNYEVRREKHDWNGEDIFRLYKNGQPTDFFEYTDVPRYDETIGAMRPNTEEEALSVLKAYEQGAEIHKAPDAPFRDNYTDFVMKRLIREAAEKGYDSIGWTTADIQSDRWSEQYAEGYRIEYDQDIPKFLRKYGKRWGAKVGKTEIQTKHLSQKQEEDLIFIADILEEGEDYIRSEKGIVEVWSMPITDSMWESVLFEGQPLYSDRDPAAQKTAAALSRENKHLKEDVKNLRELVQLQNKVTGGTKVVRADVDKMAKLLMKNNDVKGDYRELTPLLTEVYEYIARNDEVTWEGVVERSRPAVDWLMEHVRQTDKLDPYAQEILDVLKGSSVRFNETQKKEAAYHSDGWGKYRNSIIGTIGVSDKAGTTLDQLWAELAESYPATFDASIPDAQQPAELAEIIEELRNMKELDDGYSDALFEQSLMNDVYDGYWRVSTLHTVADKYQAQIDQLKHRHFKKMKESKARLDSTVKRLKEEKKDALKQLRKKKDEQIKETTERYKESRAEAVNKRRLNAAKKKIRRVISQLDKLLTQGTKERNVKEELKGFVAKALHSAEAFFADEYSDIDMIRNGIGTQMTSTEAERAEQVKEIVDEIDEINGEIDALMQLPSAPQIVEQIDALQTEVKALEQKAKYRINTYLSDVMIRERARLSETKLTDVITELMDAYKELENADGYLKGVYDEYVYAAIENKKKVFGGTVVKDMDLSQLEELHDLYSMVLHTVRNANKAFASARNESIASLAERVVSELGMQHRRKKQHPKGTKTVEKFSWNNEKPVYAFMRMGSEVLGELYEEIRKGEDVWAKNMEEAREYYLAAAEKYNLKSWDMDTVYEFVSASGDKFGLTIDQMMSIYAYAKREQAADHLRKGGIVISDDMEVVIKKKGIPLKYESEDATAYDISDVTLQEIVKTLKEAQPEAIGFADEMQAYLSDEMGAKGNEVSLKLYGVKLFKDQNYFPLKSADQYLERAREQQERTGKIKNKGFTKDTVQHASNPIVLNGFLDTWAGHVNEMSMYHAFTLPMEDFYRVYNYSTKHIEGESANAVIPMLQNTHGRAATNYIDDLLKDLNGGARADPRENTAAYMVGNFKKAAVFASASVVIQQPSSIARAFAEVEPKYFVGEKIDAKTHKETWAEVKKYAPVAIIKEMGYFDTNMGRSSKDYLLAQKYEGWEEKAKALITDGDFRDEVLSKAPALADELAWCGIWNAVKREQALANPTLATSSEEFLEICGKRFTEVIAKTQVYDSVLARSGNMRAKGVFMSMCTAFMGEPTVSVNMMEHAVRKLVKDGDREIFAKTSGAVVSSIVLNSLLVSLVYAMRDDDEESTFIEKYVSRALTEIADGLNPLTYYPGIKDVWSILQGYDVERADMSLISDLTSAMTKAAQLLAKDTTDMSEEELAEHRKKVANSMLSVVDYTTAMFGLPVKNVRRDILAAKNFITTVGKDISERDTSWGSLMDKAWDSVKNTIPVIGLMGDESKADKLYDATVKGDTAYVKRLNSTYSTESSLNSALRKGLRENDPRIREAAIAWNAGNNAKYQQIARDIVAEKHFSQDNIVKAIRAEANALKPE